MLQVIRGLAVVGLVCMALGAIVSHLPGFAFVTGTLLIFAAGLLTLTLTIPRRQWPWTNAMLASLILSAFWSLTLDRFLLASSQLPPLAVLNTISAAFALAIPALLALVYTIHAARSALVTKRPLPGETVTR